MEDRKDKKDKEREPVNLHDEESSSLHDSHDQPGNPSVVSLILGIIFCPFTLCGSCFTVDQNQEIVTLNYGRYTGVVKEPGLHFQNCFGRELIPISKAKNTMELPHTKVIDKNGNPVMVSGVVFYYYRNTRKVALDVLTPEAFVRDQASAVMKQIVSQYPYEHHMIISGDSDEEDTHDEVPCLKSDTNVISEALVKELQKRVQVVGVQIDSFRFNEVSYAPEVSVSLLKRQQAEAIITARTTLVDGAVRIASSTINRLEKRGIGMAPAERTRLVSNLLTVICAEEQVSPVLSLGST